ncbi:MBL fold metallo-hydrolase [Rapidithrix thailandica]|uniref:MBL fold metallo-hydrolase n=1 Tax=Rapidithrix thailandica TaxID=413964 RepID=A0AAW9S6U1_9BACT
MIRLKNSEQFENGKFKNTTQTQVSTGSLWKVMKEYLTDNRRFKKPEKVIPVHPLKASDFSKVPSMEYKVYWLGHSSFILELNHKRFLIDPVLSERASMFDWVGPKRFIKAPVSVEEMPALDGVIISHDHYDHLDKQTIITLSQKGLHFYLPLGVGSHLARWGVAADQLHEFDWWQSFQVGNVEIHCTPARHFSGRGILDRNATLWASWTFIGETQRVFYSGDTGMMPGFEAIGKRFGPFDLTLMQVGAYDKNWSEIHLFPEEAAVAQEALQGKVMIPLHWGTFDLALHDWFEPATKLENLSQNASWRLAFPKIGEAFTASRSNDTPYWWKALLEE